MLYDALWSWSRVFLFYFIFYFLTVASYTFYRSENIRTELQPNDFLQVGNQTHHLLVQAGKKVDFHSFSAYPKKLTLYFLYLVAQDEEGNER